MEPTHPLTVIEQRVQLCTDCNLCEIRDALDKDGNTGLAVPGAGPYDADIVIIGEAPGRMEHLRGKPFANTASNGAGTILNRMLVNAGISRSDVYVTNMIKCWPGEGNPDPLPEQLDACAHWLDEQLDIIRPKGIITLGKFSTSKYMEFKTMGSVQGHVRIGQWPDGARYHVMPVYHPAYLARNKEEEERSTECLRLFKEIVDDS